MNYRYPEGNKLSVDLSITHIFFKKKKTEFNMSVGLVRIFYNPPCSISEISKSCTNSKKIGMVVRHPRKSFESSCAMVKILQRCLLYRFSCIWGINWWAFCISGITFAWPHHHIYLLIPLLLIPNLHHDLNPLFLLYTFWYPQRCTPS